MYPLIIYPLAPSEGDSDDEYEGYDDGAETNDELGFEYDDEYMSWGVLSLEMEKPKYVFQWLWTE